MMTLQFDPKRHILVELGSLSKWLRREFSDRPLFIYKHLETGNFIIAEWLFKDRGAAVEHHVIGVHPQQFTRQDAVQLRKFLYGNTTCKEFLELAKKHERAMDEQAMVDQENMWFKPRYQGHAKASMVVPHNAPVGG